MDDNYLTHYGVPGMKWGVRKAKLSSSFSETKSKVKESTKQFANKTKKSAKKYYNTRKNYTQKIDSRKRNKYTDLSNLSDTELRNRINRMQMERQYSSLLKDQKYAVTVGKNVSEDIIYKNGKQTLNQLVKKGMRTAVKLS